MKRDLTRLIESAGRSDFSKILMIIRKLVSSVYILASVGEDVGDTGNSQEQHLERITSVRLIVCFLMHVCRGCRKLRGCT